MSKFARILFHRILPAVVLLLLVLVYVQRIRKEEAVKIDRIGVVVGTIWDQMSDKYYPEAEIVYLDSVSDEVMALSTGRIDGFFLTGNKATPIKKIYPNLRLDDTVLQETLQTCYAVPMEAMDSRYRKDLDEYLIKARADGTLDEVFAEWHDQQNYRSLDVEIAQLEPVNGTLRVATNTSEGAPYVFRYYNSIVGMDIDILVRFCKEYGYGLELTDMTFSAVLAYITSGKADLAASDIVRTEEREKVIGFTEPYCEEKMVLVTLEEEAADDTDLLKKAVESFERTFVTEERWKIVAEGVGVTAFISVLAVLIGTVLGFVVYLISRGRPERLSFGLADLGVEIFVGIPNVVLLMIFYYIIFGNSGMTGEWVAVLSFSLVFGARIYYDLRAMVLGVDPGQYEAARALGYSDLPAFYRAVFPQIRPSFEKAYENNCTNLIRSTSVVGFVAVMDLTKAADVIRGRTYDAFFPLIISAVLYYLLEKLAEWLLRFLWKHRNPRKRTEESILKGVNRK